MDIILSLVYPILTSPSLSLSGKRFAIDCVMHKTIFVINIIIHMCLQHSNTL